jgi:hypothetical protein
MGAEERQSVGGGPLLTVSNQVSVRILATVMVGEYLLKSYVSTHRLKEANVLWQ